MSNRPGNERLKSHTQSHHYVIYGHAEYMKTTLNHIFI